ncbi:phthiocerol type I polyketide synthase PpsB [Mycobacterium cookii]|uniref:Phthiocerol/phenolphthiocerol synthesis polyketide synthase type I PpsB n=1 Tax=Mycobacterium cookii TaxID=1775 RepID=A0A7I7KUM9_9MYCO|nr:type I polyketide synthase [Mycobacterium cookii]MCV7331462.1 SDR family NAD(P)-dependent oxidoreductase [Mycobacterium cookii]BBX45815.1 phthiocerol/phenolphthiocerol synthesis polyketide synthase type I PpsB [Mycobacterium cookii]
MTSSYDEGALRHWLADYLVTNVGCNPYDIDFDAPMSDLGLGSRDVVVLSGELSELLGRKVSPVEFWQHPSIAELARFLTDADALTAAEAEDEPHRVQSDEPIAVIGLGCRFPGGIHGPDEFWEFMVDGKDAVTEVPPDRWAPFDDGSPETTAALARTTRFGGYLDDIDAFDAEFFDISSREATKMDPQQRMLLEVAWEALEHAGIPPSSLRRSQTGVFTGACYTDYGYVAALDLTNVDAWSNSGGALSIVANRLSYFLDLRGPSVTVDTACSSSIVALHLACQSLRTGDSDVALAGGVNLMLAPAVVRAFDQTGALSPTGACHAFDADADGFIRGEGCGMVVLKRLSDAVRDGDRLLAVVRGSAVNQDGRSNGLLAPNPAAQMAVLRSAYANAGVPPQEVDYIEAHGTGTPLGDPIEARALGTVLGRGRPEDAPLLIGTVKTNIGHLEGAAGAAGLIKAVLAVQRGSIPANLHFHNPNEHIPFDQLRLKVVDKQQDWPQTEHPRRAGISSFGFGGTNAHAVIEQAPAAVPVIREADPAVTTLVVSGKSKERIASLAASLADWLEGDGANVRLPDVAHTLNYHRERHPHFATVAARDRAQAVERLRVLADGRAAEGVVAAHDGPCGPGTVFVYSGQGSHWAGMGRQLLADEPVFAEAIAELDPIFVEQVGFSLQKIIETGEPISGDAQVQPVLMGLQLALTELWRSCGVHPDAVIGHSMGEVSAAVAAGALSVVDGLRVIAIRSKLMSQLAGQGAVGLLKLDAEATEALIADYPDVTAAGYISPKETVIAGPVAAVDAVIAAVSAQNKFARRVNMEVASHTAFMDPILDDLRTALADLTPEIPTIPFYSTVTEGLTSPLLDADYWVANVRRPALLSQAVAAAADEHTTFIEISAHPILTHAVTDTLDPANHHHSTGTLWRDGDDTVIFHTNLNTVHTNHPPQTSHPVEPHPVLPTTPWHHGHYWVNPRPLSPVRSVAGPVDSAALDGPIPSEWYLQLDWPVRELSAAEADADNSWLVITDSGLGAEIGHVLGDEFAAMVEPSSLLADGADPTAITDALAGVTHVLYAPEVTGGPFDFEAGYALFNAARRLSAAIADMGVAPRLYLLSRNAQPVSEGDRGNPAHAVLWGLGRTLALEHPEFWGGVIDVDESVPDGVVARYVVDEARADDGEDQVVYRAGQRRVPRLHKGYPPATEPATLDKDHSYLVIGATGNIGPHLIRQLSESGAGTVVAVSRNPGSKLDELAASLVPAGTSVVTVAADAADESAMSAVFDRFGADLPPLAGIYVAAFAGGPITLLDMTTDDVTAMFRPKLDVVSLLHRLSVRHAIEQFVLFSSISGLTGSRWLAHYTATTTFLDTFAMARRAAGLPATAINWGLWKSLSDGQSEEERQVTSGSGLLPMADDVAIKVLPLLTGPGAPARPTVVAADWGLLATAYRTRAALHIVDDLLTVHDGADDGGAAHTTKLRETLRDAEPARRRGLLVDHVTTQVVQAMGLASPQLLDPTAGFFQSGMDSLMSVTLQRALSDSLGETLPASVVFDYPTVEALSDYLATLLPELVEAAEDDDADAYDDFSDDELLKQLSDRLG